MGACRTRSDDNISGMKQPMLDRSTLRRRQDRPGLAAPATLLVVLQVLLMLPVALQSGCAKPESRGSGTVVTTEDGVLIDQLVIEDDKVVVNERGIRPDDQSGADGSRKYIIERRPVAEGEAIRLRIENRRGGLAIEVDQSSSEVVVESVVSVPGARSRANDELLSGVGVELGGGPKGWTEIRTTWPGGRPAEAIALIRVAAPSLASLDLRTGEGPIIVSPCSGDVELRTGRGSISVVLPAGWNGRVQAEALGGRVETVTTPEVRLDWSSFQENRADFRLGESGEEGANARIKTGDGSIRITVG